MIELSGIYKIICKNNNKFYIGSSINIDKRLKEHVGSLRRNKHGNKYLQDSWNKYGEENFRYEIIETIYNTKNLPEREKYWIDITNCCNKKIGFNISSTPHTMGTGRFVDLTGQRFGNFIAIRPIGKNKKGNYLWLCKCDCGNEKIVRADCLKSGSIKSCGCLGNGNGNFKHGHTKNGKASKTHLVWSNILGKCNNENNRDYCDYGGCGITICDRWNPERGGSFKNFLEDVGEIPRGLIFDKIDNSRNYEPNNWRFITRKERARNRKNTKFVIFNNKSRALIELAEEHNINISTLTSRLNKGLSIKEALTIPINLSKRRK